MKKLLKKSLAIVLTMLFLCGSFSASAVVVNGKNHFDYGSYVLLGDSVASGWSDIEDRDTCFTRVEGSYGAVLADDLGVEYHPMACIGFRTLEMRYMFEDDFVGDRFMFYSVEQEFIDEKIPEIRAAVADAGLITLNVGGNDWGSFVGWHLMEELEKVEGSENFVEKALPYLENTVNFGVDTIETIVGLADIAGLVPELVKILPMALNKGMESYIKNWNIMIEDIYALNPDVTLVVIGMFDTGLQDETMDDVEGVIKLPSGEVGGINIGQTIVDLANTPMRQNAEEYGYIFIDPIGTLCESQHPSYAGHRHIADLILEALPDADFPYTDIEKGTKEYGIAQKLYAKGYMYGVSDTEFAPSSAITKAQLAEVLYNAAGAPAVEGALNDTSSASAVWCAEKGVLSADGNGNFAPDEAVSYFGFAQAMFKFSQADGFSIGGFINGISIFLKVLVQNIARIGNSMRRIDAASYIVSYLGF